ncbi:hypothetical protein B0F90DRAFT_402570 [Multifurca ochricompacta]|uniref:Nephrocystin 3-like N-terminal domain-containing protein n=1 Tax=Multifurca ochricompacta TaxID=376703 RepID=A0AAD4QJ45_9AGAM|nr:hypothetical protein B0F90DRAFT_402570 [Multifurca ochricompacta]
MFLSVFHNTCLCNSRHLQAAKDVVKSHETLANLFERIQNFLQRLNIYTGIPLTPHFTELLGKIMAQVLAILAVSTKAMTQRRIKKYLKKLVGGTEVEDALQRLDTLTQEEARMGVARNLEVTHDIDRKVKVIKETTEEVDGNVRVMKKVVEDVNKNTSVVKEVTYIVDENVKVIKEATVKLGRNQSREKLRTWFSPPNPSINHNIAQEAHHGDTATWFTQGRTFNEWKAHGSLLWIRGNPGSGKSILCSAVIEEIKRVREFGTALMGYFYFDFRDLAKRDLRGLLSSLLIQLCDYSEDCCAILSQLFITHREGSEQPSEGTLAKCLRTMLELPGQLPIYIIIDALDECPNKQELHLHVKKS